MIGHTFPYRRLSVRRTSLASGGDGHPCVALVVMTFVLTGIMSCGIATEDAADSGHSRADTPALDDIDLDSSNTGLDELIWHALAHAIRWYLVLRRFSVHHRPLPSHRPRVRCVVLPTQGKDRVRTPVEAGADSGRAGRYLIIAMFGLQARRIHCEAISLSTITSRESCRDRAPVTLWHGAVTPTAVLLFIGQSR